MAAHTAQQPLIFRHLVATVEQDVVAVVQHDGALIPEGIAEKGVRVSDLFALPVKHFPSATHIGSDIGLVVGQAEVEMAVRSRLIRHRAAKVAEFGLVEEKGLLLPHLRLITMRRAYRVPLLVDDVHQVLPIAGLRAELLSHHGRYLVPPQEGAGEEDGVIPAQRIRQRTHRRSTQIEAFFAVKRKQTSPIGRRDFDSNRVCGSTTKRAL